MVDPGGEPRSGHFAWSSVASSGQTAGELCTPLPPPFIVSLDFTRGPLVPGVCLEIERVSSVQCGLEGKDGTQGSIRTGGWTHGFHRLFEMIDVYRSLNSSSKTLWPRLRRTSSLEKRGINGARTVREMVNFYFKHLCSKALGLRLAHPRNAGGPSSQTSLAYG